MVSHHSDLEPIRIHGDDRDRTDDPLLAKQVLSQLSYAPLKQWSVLAAVGFSRDRF